MSQSLWILVGGNGAGKSSYYNAVLKEFDLPFLNADLIAKGMDGDNPEAMSYEAAEVTRNLVADYIAAGHSFCYETVFSHESKIDLIKLAKKSGYRVTMVYIYLTPGLHEARVAERVSKGGHNVNLDKITARIERLIENVARAAPLVDECLILDNSYGDSDTPAKQITVLSHGRVQAKVDPLPTWAQKILFP